MSISILANNEVLYFSSRYADREKGLSASENTLYELASVSKAFTGMGILLMEEQGLLSMSDSIQKYLPWFTLKYQGNHVDMQSITLNNFIYFNNHGAYSVLGILSFLFDVFQIVSYEILQPELFFYF